MPVNFLPGGFFTNRSVVGSGIFVIMSALFFIASSFTKHSDRDLRAKYVNLIIREIGHRLLLQARDSTSRVLPVRETKEGTFLLQFENEFVFSHDSLMALSQGLLPKTQFPSGYTVTVHDCLKTGIVYGFQLNNTSADILPCKGRSSPPSCYTIEFAFPDFYEDIEQKKADTDKLGEERKSFIIDPPEASSEPEQPHSQIVDPKLEEFKSLSVDRQGASPRFEEFKTTTFGYPLINLLYSGMLVLLSLTLLLTWHFGKILMPVPVQNRDHAMAKESLAEFAAMGKFLFDVKGQRLLLDRKVISLTDKECKILELLHKNFGELIPRETLMEKIWINEGVITSRSLDMFVSKLRKKLSGDPELRITNVHGKGYKLEIPSGQT